MTKTVHYLTKEKRVACEPDMLHTICPHCNRTVYTESTTIEGDVTCGNCKRTKAYQK